MIYKDNNMIKQNKIEEYNAIDVTKFICSILVVAIHVSPLGFGDNMGLANYVIQQYIARIAVPFFFIASGFFLYKKSAYENFDINITKNYALKLLRLYIIWSIIYLPLYIKKFLLSEKDVFHGTLRYLRDFIFTGSWTPLWYLSATFFVIILISFLLKKRISLKYIIICAAIIYVLGLLGQTWFGIITPLRTYTPQLWSILKLSQKVIVNTRYGLFMGFLFIGMGMIFAFKDFNITKKNALIGFIISFSLLFVEVIFVKYFKLIYSHDGYIFLVPSAFFLFCFVLNIRLKNNSIYKNLRIMSSLIFYMHFWLIHFVSNFFKLFGLDLSKTCLRFVFTVIVSIIISLMIIKLSNIKKFHWLRKLYS